MRRVEVRNEVRLVPVLEIEPYHFSSVPLPEQHGSREHPALWAEYFQRCMADAGFTNVVPLAEGWHFVSARSLIGNPILERAIREAVQGKEPGEIPSLAGGLALIADGEALISPSCCSDLSDLRSWKQAVVQRPRSGKIWIGHPELAFSIEGERVTLTEQWEDGPAPERLIELTMPLAQLTSAVARARAEMKLFRLELAPIVARVLGSSRMSARVTNALIGG